jgi:transglutaminase-like putative cysteine protease
MFTSTSDVSESDAPAIAGTSGNVGMNQSLDLMTRDASHVALLDHRTVEWNQVRQSRYWMHQAFTYRYPGSVRELKQWLIVIPRDNYGDQQVCAYQLHVSIPTATTTTTFDTFGNRVFRVYVPQVESEITFDMRLVIERSFETVRWPRVPADEVARYLEATHLTTADARIEMVAQELLAQHAEPEALAAAVNEWVYQAMRYGRGTTSVNTTAAEALAIGQGLCQDYAHIMLTICRTAGLPARYISGHMLGEGASHAWVEVLVKDAEGNYDAVAFDPTNHRRITPSYITVAIGRDYRDVSPTSGSFIAPYSGQLTISKRAGLTHLEYR